MSFREQKPRQRLWPFGRSCHSDKHPVIFFISYDNRDEGLITGILEPLFEVEFHGHIAQPLYWRRSSVGGDPPWKQIYKWIRQCDGVLVLITENAVKNPDNILREVRYAHRFCKPVFPLKDWRLRFEQLDPFKSWQKFFTFKDFEFSEEPEFSKISAGLSQNFQKLADPVSVFRQILKEQYGHFFS